MLVRCLWEGVIVILVVFGVGRLVAGTGAGAVLRGYQGVVVFAKQRKLTVLLNMCAGLAASLCRRVSLRAY